MTPKGFCKVSKVCCRVDCFLLELLKNLFSDLLMHQSINAVTMAITSTCNISNFVTSLGGLIFIPQKHKSGSRIKYNSGFFLTTNEYPDFGNERDCQAIRTRLDVFESTSLPKKDKTVTREYYLKIKIIPSCSNVWG